MSYTATRCRRERERTLRSVLAAFAVRWGEWYRICDESAAERWRLIESAPPGPERDRMLRPHAAIAGIYAAHDPRDPTGDGSLRDSQGRVPALRRPAMRLP